MTEENTRYELTFTKNMKHYRDLVQLAQKNTYRILGPLIPAVLIPVVMISVTVIIGIAYGLDSDARDYILYASGLSILLFFLPFLFLSNLLFKRFLRSDGLFSSGTKMVLSTIGIQEETNNSSASYKWGCVLDFKEMKNTFILMVDNSMGITIPKTAFSSEDERNEVKRFIESQITNNNS